MVQDCEGTDLVGFDLKFCYPYFLGMWGTDQAGWDRRAGLWKAAVFTFHLAASFGSGHQNQSRGGPEHGAAMQSKLSELKNHKISANKPPPPLYHTVVLNRNGS